MGFPYFKSKLYTFDKSVVSWLSKIVCQQGQRQVPKVNYRGLPYIGRRFYRTNQEVSNVVAGSFSRLPRSIKACALVTIVFGSLQLVPVSDRVHLTISQDKLENILGTLQWENEARENAGKILSPLSRESIRVQRILGQILKATHDTLGLKNDYHVSMYVPMKNGKTKHKSKGYVDASLVSRLQLYKKVILGELFHSNSKRVLVKPQKVRKFGLKYGTEHLDGLNWEVMVVDSYIENAAYLPNGKIIFHTGWFKRNPGFTDAEIATILAHEVGHGLGRHASEVLIRALWLAALIILPLSKLNYVDRRTMGALAGAIVAFFSRRMEQEADYIGMMLLAAAGYDPRHAPKFYNKHGNIETDFMTSTHPSGEKRAKKLKDKRAMRKAFDIFNRVQAGHEIKTII